MLIEDGDFVADDRVVVRGRRAEHIRKILKAQVGSRLKIGRLNGPLGEGWLTRVAREEAELEVRFDASLALPPASKITLAVAMCRPPTLSKVLQQGTAMGIKRFEFFHCRQVEKSYWDAKAVEPEALHKELILGLEQGVDTQLPSIALHRRFRPFAEDVLGVRTRGRVVVADPSAESMLEPSAEEQVLVLGPEGGFIPFEVELLRERGFSFTSLGPRILRVETAVVAMLGQQMLAC